jgi:anti-anti-sigma factor
MTFTTPEAAQDDPSALTVVVRLDRASTVVLLGGDLDGYARLALSQALSRVIATRRGDVVIDLAEVRFLDSAGIRELEVARDVLNRQARRLIVRAPSAMAAQILGLLGLSDLIEPTEASHR